MPTEPNDAAVRARENREKLRAAFQELLRQIGIEGWHLVSFRIEPEARGLVERAPCGPDEEYDCRYIGGQVVCGCFPK